MLYILVLLVMIVASVGLQSNNLIQQQRIAYNEQINLNLEYVA